jgi:membrane associated rhomboid family serine protease
MITYTIIALNCIFSIIGFSDRNFFAKYLFNPYSIHQNKKEWYRIFTHAFLHADYMHLFFNMFTFYIFGRALEMDFFPALFPAHDKYYFILLYVGGIMAASLPSLEKHKNNPGYSSVGASGAVCAVLFSYILISPTTPLQLMFIPIPIPAAIYGLLFLLLSWYLSKRGGGRIAHDAHFWGSIFGFAFTLLLKFSLLSQFIEQIKSIF